MSTREELIAELEGAALKPMPRQNAGRLAYEIAIGIWLGGMALGLTWTAIGLLFFKAFVASLKL